MVVGIGDAPASRASVLFSTVAYGTCSSLAIVTNKVAIHRVPLPGLIFCLQLAATVSFIVVLRSSRLIEADTVSWSAVKTFIPYVCSFNLSLYSNGRALAASNVETVIVFRPVAALRERVGLDVLGTGVALDAVVAGSVGPRHGCHRLRQCRQRIRSAGCLGVPVGVLEPCRHRLRNDLWQKAHLGGAIQVPRLGRDLLHERARATAHVRHCRLRWRGRQGHAHRGWFRVGLLARSLVRDRRGHQLVWVELPVEGVRYGLHVVGGCMQVWQRPPERLDMGQARIAEGHVLSVSLPLLQRGL